MVSVGDPEDENEGAARKAYSHAQRIEDAFVILGSRNRELSYESRAELQSA